MVGGETLFPGAQRRESVSGEAGCQAPEVALPALCAANSGARGGGGTLVRCPPAGAGLTNPECPQNVYVPASAGVFCFVLGAGGGDHEGGREAWEALLLMLTAREPQFSLRRSFLLRQKSPGLPSRVHSEEPAIHL